MTKDTYEAAIAVVGENLIGSLDRNGWFESDDEETVTIVFNYTEIAKDAIQSYRQSEHYKSLIREMRDALLYFDDPIEFTMNHVRVARDAIEKLNAELGE